MISALIANLYAWLAAKIINIFDRELLTVLRHFELNNIIITFSLSDYLLLETIKFLKNMERLLRFRPRRIWHRLFHRRVSRDQQEQQDENNPLIGNEENIVPPADFDLQLPGRHSYLGEGMEELQGRVLFDDGGPTPEIPLIVMGIQLVPGQTLPLTIFHAVFQNAIRRCIGTNKVFGIVHNELDTSSGSAVYNGAFGTIAEIYEFQEESDPPNGHPMGLSTFALKAKGRQRFNVISFRRQADGNLMGMVRVRPEIRLPPMVQSVMLGQTHRYRYPIKRQYEDVSMDESGAENNEPTTRKLAKLLSISSNSSSKEDDALVDADLAKMRAEILDKRKMTKFYSAFTPFPYFVYEQFDESVLVERIHRKLRIDLKGLTDSSRIPKDATELSFWLAQNLTMDDHHRMRILKMDSPVSRLRYELDLLSRACKVITCRKCQTSIAESTEIFSMSVEGPQGTYVNPQGFVHETLTVHKTKREVVLRGRSSTEASWFPGYSWTIAECRRCLNHLGWKFKAVGRLKPQQFWGLSRRSISFKYNFLTEEETAAAAEFNTRSRNQSTSEASMSS
ncbi:protein cereblon isoform X2 [Folsomia candida]|uniref:Protein cereblon n=1 Tax=Folsomia candida TaxID=158441 RepID=A0A226DZU4_FOLCA|nr:protein cereblon isoform X2 [Folsomia candida]OXA50221.1 Protein cereblon [Folsomia candida]